MQTLEILALLEEHYPECLLADGFEDAIVGVVDRACKPTLVCYDYERCVEILLRDSQMDEEEAREYLEYNTTGAYVGEYTPVFLQQLAGPRAAPRDGGA